MICNAALAPISSRHVLGGRRGLRCQIDQRLAGLPIRDHVSALNLVDRALGNPNGMPDKGFCGALGKELLDSVGWGHRLIMPIGIQIAMPMGIRPDER